MTRFRHAAILLAIALLARSAAAQDMPLSGVLLDGEGWELVADGFKFTEGPAADAAGNVFFTDVPASKIYKIDAAGAVSLFAENTERTNGLMFGPGGLLYGCQNGKRRIVTFDSAGKVAVVAEDVSCNDIAVTRGGGVYFTDPGNSQVWYVSPGGKKRVVDKGIERPNGVILWGKEGTLVVADTRGKHLWAFRIEKDGSLTHKQPYYTMRLRPGRTQSGADGMTVDARGRLYVATHAGLQMFDTTARLGGVILKPQNKFLSNATFGGPKFDTLYVTCTDKVYRRRTKTKGVGRD